MTRSQALFRSQLDGAGIFMLWLVKQELLGPWYSLPVKKIWPFVHGGHHPLPAPRRGLLSERRMCRGLLCLFDVLMTSV